MMEYFNSKRQRSKSPTRAGGITTTEEAPVLNEEDEAFLHRIATEGVPPELPERHAPPLPTRPQDLPEAGEVHGNNAQIALFNGAQDIPIPDTPDTPDGVLTTAEGEQTEKSTGKQGSKKSRWSWLRRDSRDARRQATATGLMSAAEGLKSPDAQPNEDHQVSDPEAKKEEEEMSHVLEELNLAAVNNRVFSISTESKELLHKFTLVLKDLVNGVPTAYGDLESLLTNSEGQLQKGYTKLPPWLQKLVEQLPSKMTKSIGPEMLAAAAAKPGASASHGTKMKVPSLQDLVTKPGAIVGMLKAIMNFLKLRFPAFLGMNVLYSLALFILLFALWYCHKRGREVRLGQEAETAQLEDDAAGTTSAASPMNTGADGAPGASVQGGISSGREADALDAQGTKRTKYAEGGSLAQYEREKAQGKVAEVEVTEVEDRTQDGVGESSEGLAPREKELRKQERRAARWRAQPSKAPLDSQESCLVS